MIHHSDEQESNVQNMLFNSPFAAARRSPVPFGQVRPHPAPELQIHDRVALGAGLGIWGVINLLEGYGQDSPASNAHVP